MNGQSCDTRSQNHKKSLKRKWTPRPLSDSKRVMCVTCHSDLQTPGQVSSRAVMKTSIRFLEWKSRLFKHSSSAGSWGHKGGAAPGAPWPTQRLRAQVQGKSHDGGDGRLSTPLLVLPLSYLWLWSRVRDVLTLSQPLGYSSNEEIAHMLLIKLHLGEDSNEELKFGMLLTQN